MTPTPLQALAFLVALYGTVPSDLADEKGWTALTSSSGFEAFRGPTGTWQNVTDVKSHPTNPRLLVAEGDNGGVIVNGPKGRTTNLITKKSFGDSELSFEFLIPRGSNSGVKFHAVYEIQIHDSFGVKILNGTHCGGVYPRAEELPTYRHLDKGIAPQVNACKAPGQWQSLHVLFQAPRFDSNGKKTANARIVRAELNGQVIHEDLELKTPTGANWSKPEKAEGPLLFQADHGPVAFRNVRVRPYVPEKK